MRPLWRVGRSVGASRCGATYLHVAEPNAEPPRRIVGWRKVTSFSLQLQWETSLGWSLSISHCSQVVDAGCEDTHQMWRNKPTSYDTEVKWIVRIIIWGWRYQRSKNQFHEKETNGCTTNGGTSRRFQVQKSHSGTLEPAKRWSFWIDLCLWSMVMAETVPLWLGCGPLRRATCTIWIPRRGEDGKTTNLLGTDKLFVVF